MDEQEKNKLLQESAKRSLTADEQDKLDRWYISFDVSEKQLKIFQSSEHEEKVRVRLLNKIFSHIPKKKQSSKIREFLNKPSNWMKVAAVFAFFIISFPLFYYIKTNYYLGALERPILSIGKANVGKILKVNLSDGSEIWLNSGSIIKYPTQFTRDKREVYLEGEAFFKIKPDKKKPFIVNTGKIKTTVLGTSFNIRAYPEIDQIKVTVATGKVAIATKDKLLSLLYPNQQINYHTLSEDYEISKTDINHTISWQEGEVRLDGVSFRELSLMIKNTWGYNLETKNTQLQSANYKTTFNKNNTIKDVMRVISKITNARYQIENNIITLDD